MANSIMIDRIVNRIYVSIHDSIMRAWQRTQEPTIAHNEECECTACIARDHRFHKLDLAKIGIATVKSPDDILDILDAMDTVGIEADAV